MNEFALPASVLVLLSAPASPQSASRIGKEVSIAEHLADGQEFTLPLSKVVRHGRQLFAANWTPQEGGGRPLSKGTGNPLSDPTRPLEFPRSFNRLSAPDANSCMGCHNAPMGIVGGGGDIVTNVFVLAQRFDFATFDPADPLPTGGTFDEVGRACELQTIANSRSTLGMFGAGYIEMLARQMTVELQAIRDGLAPGETAPLRATGVGFGTLARDDAGAWVTTGVEGLAPASLASSGPTGPPSLILLPFHQAGTVVSLRQFSNNAFNHHHGIQPTERFGSDDADGDGFLEELTIADVTAVSVFQATLPVPGRVIPRDPEVERAILRGEDLFVALGCTVCHVPYLELLGDGSIYTEPNPFNPPGNLTPESPYVAAHGDFEVDLADPSLPQPRLRGHHGITRVPAFTDLKLHDITSGPDDPNREPLDMQHPAGSPDFFAGNSRFVTKKLWGMANEPPYFHHGLFTTIRQAVEAHAGEAQEQRDGYGALPSADQDALIEFLKTLQILSPGTRHSVVDEHGQARRWRNFPG